MQCTLFGFITLNCFKFSLGNIFYMNSTVYLKLFFHCDDANKVEIKNNVKYLKLKWICWVHKLKEFLYIFWISACGSADLSLNFGAIVSGPRPLERPETVENCNFMLWNWVLTTICGYFFWVISLGNLKWGPSNLFRPMATWVHNSALALTHMCGSRIVDDFV